MEKAPLNKSKIAVMGGVAVIALCVIVYFSFFYPPTKNIDAAGTIGAAKKYQSEQITDKDVKLEGASTEAPASSPQSIVDEKTAKEFAATAEAFGKAFSQFNSQYNIGSQFAVESKATINSLAAMAAKAGRADFGSRGSNENPTESISAKQTIDKGAASDVYNQAAALANKASEIMAKNPPSLDKQTINDLSSRMHGIYSKASELSKAIDILSNKEGLDSRPGLGNAQLEKQKGLGNAQLEKQKGLEKSALENQQSLEKRKLENQQSLEKSKLENQQSLEKRKLENQQSLEKSKLENQQSLENRPKQ